MERDQSIKRENESNFHWVCMSMVDPCVESESESLGTQGSARKRGIEDLMNIARLLKK